MHCKLRSFILNNNNRSRKFCVKKSKLIVWCLLLTFVFLVFLAIGLNDAPNFLDNVRFSLRFTDDTSCYKLSANKMSFSTFDVVNGKYFFFFFSLVFYVITRQKNLDRNYVIFSYDGSYIHIYES